MKDNTLLVDFAFVIDMDLAMYRFIKDKYGTSPFVNDYVVGADNPEFVIFEMLHRKDFNPLSILIYKDLGVDKLYNEIYKSNYKELLSYAKPYDTLALMTTLLNNASSLDITILCASDDEVSKIRSYTNKFNIVKSKASEIDLDKYTAIYVNRIIDLLNFNYEKLQGKHIFIANAYYNMDQESTKPTISPLGDIYGDVNEFHSMDLYVDIKYNINDERSKLGDENSKQHSTTGEIKTNSEQDFINFG